MKGGDRYERDLVNALDATGEFVAMRCPTSGSSTDRNLPDVVALRPTGDMAIEVKTTKATTAYAGGDEVAGLEAFADRAGALPVIAAKFKRPGKRTPFYLVEPAACRVTDAGNHGVPEADAADRARFAVWAATDTKPAEFERRPGDPS